VPSPSTKVAFVENLCTHYTRGLFEALARRVDLDCVFFSPGNEWYWQPERGASTGDFKFEYLKGFDVGHTRVSPTLPQRLLQNDYDVYIKCINGKFAIPITYLVARMRKKPFILRTGVWMRLLTPLHRLLYPVTKYLYHHSDAIVVYGSHVKRYLISEGVPAERIFVAGNAADNSLYGREVPAEEKTRLRQSLGVPLEQKIVLYVGRFEEVKGPRYLIDAFARLDRKDAVLVLVGSGSHADELQQQVASLGIADRVRFPGNVTPEETVAYFSIAWVDVVPSVTMPAGNETWGFVANEALNQGVPVIATTAVGAAAGGLVADGINGLVVPERDAAALARAICRVLDDADLRARLSEGALATVKDWTHEAMAQAFCDAIDYVQRASPAR
jgi:glycosyltransferase involved in cell wall biosynthesis